ncbi:MAG: TRAP transporter substrate-binding protein DctP [Chloroflexi bacterium]|nr:TRAP transporter substrate-binding protein DctP [Chloroflexota bacterium]
MKSRMLVLFTVAGLMALLLAACTGQPAATETITLKAVTAFPTNNPDLFVVPYFIDKIEKGTQGRVKVNWMGGPEVIPTNDQPDAIRKGIIEMWPHYPFSYRKPLVPAATSQGLSQLTPWEERDSGAFALWGEIFAKQLNTKYLGRPSSAPFRLWTNFKFEKLSDFKGKVFRVAPIYMPFIQALGASGMALPPAEIYGAVEKKVVDGFIWGEFGATGLGLHEVTRYRLAMTFGQTDTGMDVNLDVWNKLPKDVQNVMSEAAADTERYGASSLASLIKKEYDEKIKPAGVTDLKLSPDEEKKFIQMYYEASWAQQLKEDPDYSAKLKPLLSKK